MRGPCGKEDGACENGDESAIGSACAVEPSTAQASTAEKMRRLPIMTANVMWAPCLGRRKTPVLGSSLVRLPSSP